MERDAYSEKHTHTVIIGTTRKPIILRYEAGVSLVARTHPVRANYSLLIFFFWGPYFCASISLLNYLPLKLPYIQLDDQQSVMNCCCF